MQKHTTEGERGRGRREGGRTKKTVGGKGERGKGEEQARRGGGNKTKDIPS